MILASSTTMHSRRSSRSRSRDRSPERHELPEGVSSISESDYFLKSAEFRVWLKDAKGKVHNANRPVACAYLTGADACHK